MEEVPQSFLHKGVQVKCTTRCWLPLIFPLYHVVMMTTQDYVTAQENLKKLAGTTIEYRLRRNYFERPWSGRGQFKSWQNEDRLVITGPKTFLGAQFYTECRLIDVDEHQTRVQIMSRLNNDGMALLGCFYLIVTLLTLGLSMAGNWPGILLAWLFLGFFYVLQMWFLQKMVEEVYAFVSDWLIESGRDISALQKAR